MRDELKSVTANKSNFMNNRVSGQKNKKNATF